MGVGADLTLDGQENYSASNTYGWDMDNEQYIGGKRRSCQSDLRWTNGDWVLIKADFSAGKLSMVSAQVSTPLTMSLEVPADLQSRFVFQIMLWNSDDQVELLPVTAEDQQLLP